MRAKQAIGAYFSTSLYIKLRLITIRRNFVGGSDDKKDRRYGGFGGFMDKKDLYKSRSEKFFMNKIDRENYGCLWFYATYTIGEIKALKPKNSDIHSKRCPPYVEQRLAKKGFINLKKRTGNFITDPTGMRELNRLESIKWRFWTYVFGIVITVCAIIGLGRQFKWW